MWGGGGASKLLVEGKGVEGCERLVGVCKGGRR